MSGRRSMQGRTILRGNDGGISTDPFWNDKAASGRLCRRRALSQKSPKIIPSCVPQNSSIMKAAKDRESSSHPPKRAVWRNMPIERLSGDPELFT